VVRNGTHRPREVLTSAGAVEVTAPRVNDRRTDPQTGERRRFSSAILPPWCRKTPKITEVLPLLYLHGLSSGDFVPALGQFLGSSVGLSAPVITRLTQTWKAEQQAFSRRDLSGVDYVYLWADGIHVNIRLEEHKLCLLVLLGVRADGRKELVALADGYLNAMASAGCAPRISAHQPATSTMNDVTSAQVAVQRPLRVVPLWSQERRRTGAERRRELVVNVRRSRCASRREPADQRPP
jgi:hypothetical protein